MDLGLKNQVAIIVDGARGIGLATARLLLDEGAHVELWGHDTCGAQAAIDLQGHAPPSHAGQRVLFRQVDIVDAAACQAAVDAALSDWTNIDHLILAAAIGSGRFGFPFTNLVVPLGRWQTPEDIAAAIAFLISARARNITGQALNVDGGFVMR